MNVLNFLDKVTVVHMVAIRCALQVIQAYYSAEVPQPGQEIEFSADDTLQPVHYLRPPLHLEDGGPENVYRTQIANAEAEAATSLKNWTINVLCRCLSLDNVLLLLTGESFLPYCSLAGMRLCAILAPTLGDLKWHLVLGLLTTKTYRVPECFHKMQAVIRGSCPAQFLLLQ